MNAKQYRLERDQAREDSVFWQDLYQASGRRENNMLDALLACRAACDVWQADKDMLDATQALLVTRTKEVQSLSNNLRYQMSLAKSLRIENCQLEETIDSLIDKLEAAQREAVRYGRLYYENVSDGWESE